MANIPSALGKFNDQEISNDAPVTEALFYKAGQNLNYLVDFLAGGGINFQTFIANGTWTRPSTVSKVIVFGIGGGGCAGAEANGVPAGGGGSGWFNIVPLNVTAASYNVVIGQGVTGQAGTATTFGGTLVVCQGGANGGAPGAEGRGGQGGAHGKDFFGSRTDGTGRVAGFGGQFFWPGMFDGGANTGVNTGMGGSGPAGTAGKSGFLTVVSFGG